MLSVNDVNVFCNGHSVVERATFQLRAGEKLLLVGKSGIGKTLLAKELFRGGAGIHYDIPKDKVIYLPQNAEESFNPLKKIIDHFEDIRLQKGREKTQFYKLISEYFDYLGLAESCLRGYPFECSGGMLQRLQIILAHCQQPQLIIADEPTAALDEAYIEKMFSFWQEACKNGMAMLIVTHQLHYYKSFATAILQLEHKQLMPYKQTLTLTLKKSTTVWKSKGLYCCKMHGIAYRFSGGFWHKKEIDVLNVQNFACTQGEIVGIRGESGSGKTTFLNVLLQQVHFKGDCILPPVQYVPQLYRESLPAHWLVADVIREAQIAANASKEVCVELLEQLQLEPNITTQKVHTLSGGQSQKLALFRVLLKNPQLLLLDEVFSNLDEQSTQIITDCLLKLVQKGLTIIIVSHDEKWLDTYCTKQYIVHQQTVEEYQYEKNNTSHPYITFNSL